MNFVVYGNTERTGQGNIGTKRAFIFCIYNTRDILQLKTNKKFFKTAIKQSFLRSNV